MARYYAHITGEANIQVPFNPYQVYTSNGNYVRIELNCDNLITVNTKNNAAVWLNGIGDWFSFEMYNQGWEYFNLGNTTYIGRYNYWGTNGFEETLVLEVNKGDVTLTKGQQTSATTFSGNFASSNISFFPTTYAENTRVNFYEWKAYGTNNTLLFDFVPYYNGTTKGLRDKVSGNFYAATDQTKIELIPLTTFEITPEETDVTSEGGTTTITVNTDNDTSITWTASTSDNWLSLSTLTGAGDGSVTITYEENEAYQSRTGTITFTSSNDDVLTFTIEQAKKPFLVYDRPIYRSGSLVKKMYRSGEVIYIRLNPLTEQPEPEPPTPSEPTYQWVEVTANFDRSIPFTKVRWDFSKSWYDGYFSELPNINCDNKGWTSIRDAEWGYAGQYTMNLSAKKCYIRNQSTDSYDLYDMYAITTQVDTNLYEYEYSVPLYWGGVSSSSLYDNGLGIYVYVEVNPTNK